MKVVTGEELWSHRRGKGQWGGRGCVFLEESPTRGLMDQWVLLFGAGNN